MDQKIYLWLKRSHTVPVYMCYHGILPILRAVFVFFYGLIGLLWTAQQYYDNRQTTPCTSFEADQDTLPPPNMKVKHGLFRGGYSQVFLLAGCSVPLKQPKLNKTADPGGSKRTNTEGRRPGHPWQTRVGMKNLPGSSNDQQILVVLVIDPVFCENTRKSAQPTKRPQISAKRTQKASKRPQKSAK